MFIKVKYSDDYCHPRAYKEEGYVLNEGLRKDAANARIAGMRLENPRLIIDWHYAGGRVVVRTAKKRWYER